MTAVRPLVDLRVDPHERLALRAECPRAPSLAVSDSDQRVRSQRYHDCLGVSHGHPGIGEGQLRAFPHKLGIGHVGPGLLERSLADADDSHRPHHATSS